MIKMKRYRTTREKTEYAIFYEWVEFPDSGFSFPCSKEGCINFEEMTPTALENYEKCENGEYEVIYRGLQRYTHSWVEPAIGECYCGSEVMLEHNTNECRKCHRLYNAVGQELTDLKHWGEETGEHPADIRRWMG